MASNFISVYKVTITTVTDAGTATSEPINGVLKAVYLDFDASAGGDEVFTFTEVGAAGRTIFTAPAGNTDILYTPQMRTHSDTGTAVGYADPVLAGTPITVAVANTGDAETYIAWLYVQTHV